MYSCNGAQFVCSKTITFLSLLDLSAAFDIVGQRVLLLDRLEQMERAAVSGTAVNFQQLTRVRFIYKCSEQINEWMCRNILQLNKDKTEINAFV